MKNALHHAWQLYIAFWHLNGGVAVIAHAFVAIMAVCTWVIFFSRVRIRRDWPPPTTLEHNRGQWTPDPEEIGEEFFYDTKDRRR